jgi:lipopolysaccharide/colanic/teichoic acid biosynthesis glycosyltransferase
MRQLYPSAWCFSRFKRLFDLSCASLMLLCLLPIMLVVAIAVKLSSRGPVFFRQARCGKEGRCFLVLKFRTMTHAGLGPTLTRAGDARVTRLGRILRKWKIDEFPQLVNVIKGDMSMVGPRPDVPEYFQLAPDDVRSVLSLKPGVTGWASIHFRDEESLLAQVPAAGLRDFYVDRVLPQKARLDLEYATRATFLSDCGLLVRTIAVVLPKRSARAKGTSRP